MGTDVRHAVRSAEFSSTAHKRRSLAVLAMVFTLIYVDRGLVILLLEPIKHDLGLSDTQLGFLTGIAFGIFYATLGVPIARWADRGNRVSITSIAIGLWGATVMACVGVTNFAQLVAARIGAAVGESGCMPPTYSLLGDYFPRPAERARAMAIYWLGNPVGLLVSFGVGGWLAAQYGWRMTFFLMGLPAILIAILARLTLTEPRERWIGSSQSSSPSMRGVFMALWSRLAARHLSIAIILLWTMGGGLAPWYAAFLMRSHGMGTTELGVWLGLIFGLGGIAGILFGGYVASRWFGNDERSQMRTSAVSVGLLVPCFALFLLLPHKYQALAALVPLIVVFNFFLGPGFALLQRLVADDMRATTLALVMLLSNLIGMGVAPQVVGVMSDLLQPSLGTDSLRYAMLVSSLLALWSAWHFWRVSDTVKDDLRGVAFVGAPISEGMEGRIDAA